MRPPRNRIIRTPIAPDLSDPSDPSDAPRQRPSDPPVRVRVGKQPIFEGEFRAIGAEFTIPQSRARALASLVTII